MRILPEKIKCPNCRYTLVAATFPTDNMLIEVVKKKVAAGRLTSDEKKKWQIASKRAGLVQTYGRRAILAFEARRVGPTNAARILNTHHKGENGFYLDIIRAERNYLRKGCSGSLNRGFLMEYFQNNMRYRFHSLNRLKLNLSILARTLSNFIFHWLNLLIFKKDFYLTRIGEVD